MWPGSVTSFVLSLPPAPLPMADIINRLLDSFSLSSRPAHNSFKHRAPGIPNEPVADGAADEGYLPLPTLLCGLPACLLALTAHFLGARSCAEPFIHTFHLIHLTTKSQFYK